ncbi:MAG: glycerol-3-phosphate 1-O-acyltransferase PlsY [Candidatus Omnitrophica bacterium]|nr:glycerol-3-phosphate 1-O-acyltransferase PlsY [Candidatus Omnitrophota bacterium]
MILLPGICTAYLIGGIPTGVAVGFLFGRVDVRKHGSGNVGATNVLRVVGKLPGLIVLLVDALKGWVPVALLSPPMLRLEPGFSPEVVPIALGMAAVAGHIWNPFLQLKGGRGVATALGVLWGLDPRIALGTLGIWGAAALLTRYVSVASIAAAFFSPFWMFLLREPVSWILGGILVSLAIIGRHRSNILRLLQGEEHRLRSPRLWFT